MDTTQQTIGQIVGDFTELAHDLHDKGVINEGKLKELLDLGMALAKPNMTAYGRRSGPELYEELTSLSVAYLDLGRDYKELLEDYKKLEKDYIALHKKKVGLIKFANTVLQNDVAFLQGSIVRTLLNVTDKQNKQIRDLGGEPTFVGLRAKAEAKWQRHCASRTRRVGRVWAGRLRA